MAAEYEQGAVVVPHRPLRCFIGGSFPPNVCTSFSVGRSDGSRDAKRFSCSRCLHLFPRCVYPLRRGGDGVGGVSVAGSLLQEK